MHDVTRQIFDEISAIVPFDEIEREHRDDALRWIASGVNIFRIAKPDKPPKHLVSYFVLVDPDTQSLLLGDHVKAELWLPTGGHVERGELPAVTVEREAREELGIEAVFLHGNRKPLFITQTTTVGLTPGHVDVSLWYVLRGSRHERLQFDRREFNDIEWYTFDEILASHPAIFDPHMQRFTHKLQKYLASKP